MLRRQHDNAYGSWQNRKEEWKTCTICYSSDDSIWGKIPLLTKKCVLEPSVGILNEQGNCSNGRGPRFFKAEALLRLSQVWMLYAVGIKNTENSFIGSVKTYNFYMEILRRCSKYELLVTHEGIKTYYVTSYPSKRQGTMEKSLKLVSMKNILRHENYWFEYYLNLCRMLQQWNRWNNHNVLQDKTPFSFTQLPLSTC